jgi:hypothetical protein
MSEVIDTLALPGLRTTRDAGPRLPWLATRLRALVAATLGRSAICRTAPGPDPELLAACCAFSALERQFVAILDALETDPDLSPADVARWNVILDAIQEEQRPIAARIGELHA